MTALAEKHKMGTRLRAWRKSQLPPMKAFQLAKLIKISQGSLSDIESNKSLPSGATIHNILVLTDIDLHWLLTGRDDPRTEILKCPTCKKVDHLLDVVAKALEKS